MNNFMKKTLLLSIAAVAGGLMAVGVSMALQLYAFQSDLHKVLRVYERLKTEYLTPVPKEQLADGAIQGMLLALGDPYTEYMKGEAAAEFDELFQGEFEGIGADIQARDGQIVVISPIQGSPAAAAGLLPNDIILEADGRRLDGLSLEEAAQIIRGPKGTEISLRIRRAGIAGDFMVTVQRDTIPEQTVTFTELPGGLAAVRIAEFAGTTHAEFDKVMDQLAERDVRGIILDLRQNPGGVIDAAVDVASHFIPEGELVTAIRYRDGTVDRYISGKTPIKELPAAVLVDEGTASSAEILAGALRDSINAPLIGRRTFGKGIVQNVLFFGDGSSLKYTFGEVETPAGVRFHAAGLMPDAEVAPNKVKENDPQMQTAMDKLLEMIE